MVTKSKRFKKSKNLEKNDAEVDVTSRETHASIQCEDIRLIASSLKPLIVDKEKNKSTQFAFRVRATVEGQRAFSYLEVKVNYFFQEEIEDLQGFSLSYVLMGTLRTDTELNSTDFAHFVKMYTVTILWPYAREYASDQFRRAGNHDIVLPIINPQVVTEHIVENNLVDVEIIETSLQE